MFLNSTFLITSIADRRGGLTARAEKGLPHVRQTCETRLCDGQEMDYQFMNRDLYAHDTASH